jgi:hypothetical protein
MSDDYLWDRSGPPDPDVKQLEDLLAPLRHDAPLDEVRVRRRRRRMLPWISGVIAAVAAVLAIVFAWPRGGGSNGPCTGFAYTSGDGSGTLCVGATLDTGAATADLAIANIGRAQLGERTRVRLDRTSTEVHHLTIDRGTMHAKVNAPPRLFQVATPSNEVTDLGCEYTITIGDDGCGSIRVLSGQVELATKSGAIVTAPAGTHARICHDRPGLPVDDAAPTALVAAVDAYDRGDASRIDAMLAAAGPTDAVTIANLALLERPRRRDILVKLDRLSPHPLDVSIDDAVTDPAKLQAWLDDVRLDQRFRIEEHGGGKK